VSDRRRDRQRDPFGEIHDRLVDLIRETLGKKPGGHLVEPALRELELNLTVSLAGHQESRQRFSQLVSGVVNQAIDDAILHAAAFRPGRTFCHRCASPECEHSLPPSPRHVFRGYGPTGTPVWIDFAQHCLEERHEKVDRLYEDPPAFFTLVRSPADLRCDLLDVFRDRSTRLHGQVCAGFYQFLQGEGGGRGVLALTFQIASSSRGEGRKVYGLNILGRSGEEEDLSALWEGRSDLPWRRAVRWAQSALSTLGRNQRKDSDARIVGILQGLARRLVKDHRGSSRRTQHAENHHDSGSRPTRMALEDLTRCAEQDLFMDDRNQTLVVRGARGRTHFFNQEGRLVSSVRYSREAIAGKLKNGIWRSVTLAETVKIRTRIEGTDR